MYLEAALNKASGWPACEGERESYGGGALRSWPGQTLLQEIGLSLDLARASEVELLPSSLSGLGEAFPGRESFLPEDGACCLPQAWMKLIVSCRMLVSSGSKLQPPFHAFC